MSGGDTGICVYVADAQPPGWYELIWERDPCPICGHQISHFLQYDGASWPGLRPCLEVLHPCDPDLASYPGGS
jgi:hypothetical protein